MVGADASLGGASGSDGGTISESVEIDGASGGGGITGSGAGSGGGGGGGKGSVGGGFIPAG